MYDPRKDFEKSVNKILGFFLKSNGFKRYKGRNFIRLTTGNFLQSISFQKSAGFTYYINLNSVSLANIQKSYFPDGGLRISNLYTKFRHNCGSGRFESESEYLMTCNLEEITDFFRQKGIYWFDMLGDKTTFLEYEQNVIRGKNNYLLPLFNRAKSPNLGYAYLLLQNTKYAEAKKYLEEMSALIEERNENFYLRKKKDQIDSLLKLLNTNNFTAIDDLIKSNVQKSIANCSLAKTKPYSIEKIDLKEYLDITYLPKENNPIPGGRGFDKSFWILDSNDKMYQNLKNRLEAEFEITEVSEYRFAIIMDEKSCFHCAFHRYDFIERDIAAIYSYYQQKSRYWQGVEKENITEIRAWYHDKVLRLRNLEQQDSRIEFWSDYSSVSKDRMRKRLVRIIIEEFDALLFSRHNFNFFQENKLTLGISTDF